MGFGDYFSIPIFFIIFRETTEAAIIVSVLLSFLSQVLTDESPMRKRLARQVRRMIWPISPVKRKGYSIMSLLTVPRNTMNRSGQELDLGF